MPSCPKTSERDGRNEESWKQALIDNIFLIIIVMLINSI
jgi:hypothetical protein